MKCPLELPNAQGAKSDAEQTVHVMNKDNHVAGDYEQYQKKHQCGGGSVRS